MESFGANPLWDLSLPPSLPALADDDFIALLQKQFGANNGFPGLDNDKDTASPATNINPQSLTRLPIPRPVESPPSDDSSPSPNEATTSRSRRESLFGVPGSSRDSEDGEDDPTLKRKASEDDLDDEPSHKSQATSSSKRNTNSRRKSTGTSNPDESRLLKRKEQNRAAQRAFRERKEKHVKDLEDKVAALEEKNQAATQENESLREVVSRLQSENVRLRQSSFTFSVPPSSSAASSSTTKGPDPSRTASAELQQETPMTLFNSPPSTTTSTTASTHDSPQSMFNDNNDGQLSFLGQNLTMLNSGHQQTATAAGDAMNLDFGFGPVTQTPYTTIASNPLFMSFREPDPFDHQGQNGSQTGQAFDFSQQLFSGWPDVNMDVMGAGSMQAFDLTNSLDELFGSSFANGGQGMEFMQPNKASPSASLSPVAHQNSNKASPGMSSSSSSASSSPLTGASPGASNGDVMSCDGTTKCTKENLAKFVAQTGDSMFTPRQAPPRSDISSPSPPESGLGDNDACAEFPPCKGLQLPKTQKSEKNVEVMSAWRTIRHDPKYQDVDINQLCSEFASKAKCDGCQVVIEPSGMQEILDTVQKQKKSKQQSGLFSASKSAGLLSK